MPWARRALCVGGLMAVSRTAVNRVCPSCQKTYPYKEVHVCAQGAPPPVMAADELVGTLFGERYRIEKFLQRGGMGTVYVARHTVLDKQVAIKILNEAKDEIAQQRFLLEAKAACHINHEHIVDITDYGVLDDGRPYLVMEYLQGHALDALLAKGPLSPRRVCRIAEQIALGLQAVHEKGVLHRDLKPGNVFLLERHRKDYVKILDFGIAKVVAEQSQGLTPDPAPNAAPFRPTQEGLLLGTPEYLAPEQALGEDLDHRADQYALGCILYEMLTGDVPFRGNSAMGTVVKRLSENPVPPRQRRPELNIPETLDALTMRALARDREQRFPSMNDLALALQQEHELLTPLSGENSGSLSGTALGALALPSSRPSSPAISRPQVAAVTPTPKPAKLRRSATVLLQRLWPVLATGAVASLIVTAYLVMHTVRADRRPESPPVAAPQQAAKEAPIKPMTAEPPHASPGPAVAAEGNVKERPPAESEGGGEPRLRFTFENGSAVPVTVMCTRKPPCTMAAQKLCQFVIGNEVGHCEASARGYKPQAFTYRELRSRARAGRGRERILLDAKGLGQLNL